MLIQEDINFKALQKLQVFEHRADLAEYPSLVAERMTSLRGEYLNKQKV